MTMVNESGFPDSSFLVFWGTNGCVLNGIISSVRVYYEKDVAQCDWHKSITMPITLNSLEHTLRWIPSGQEGDEIGFRGIWDNHKTDSSFATSHPSSSFPSLQSKRKTIWCPFSVKAAAAVDAPGCILVIAGIDVPDGIWLCTFIINLYRIIISAYCGTGTDNTWKQKGIQFL